VALSPLFHCKALFGTSRAVEIGKASNLDSKFASRVLRSLSTIICTQARQCVEGRGSAETVGSSAQDLSDCIKLTRRKRTDNTDLHEHLDTDRFGRSRWEHYASRLEPSAQLPASTGHLCHKCLRQSPCPVELAAAI
jgi:hypothetical protein